ncbi:MAG: hypothetical protein ACXWIU_05560, partial [Limisphaerales bacterium]
MKAVLYIMLIAGFLEVPVNTNAADWYVDTRCNGNNSGADWVNAWTNLASIAWQHINPGDTIFLSGGRYDEPLVVRKSGLSNAPITIRVAQEREHNSPVLLNGIGLGAQHWITINGALSDSFTAPTNILGLRQMTNNIGILAQNTNGTAIYMTSANGVYLSWVGVRASRGPNGYEAHGIQANMTARGPTDNNVIKYCWINHVEDDGINWIGNDPATHFGHQEVAFCIIEYVGDDGMEANHGFTVHDCLLGPSRFLHGHPDGIQSVGSYWKIYNNEFQDFGNSWIREQATQTNHHDIWIYNNLFLSGIRTNESFLLSNTGIEVVQYAAWLGDVPAMTWSNIIVVNNTFFNATNAARGAINWAKRDENTPGAFVHNVFLTNCLFVNNLVVDCAYGASAPWQPVKTVRPWGAAVNYAPEDLIWDYNTITGFKANEATRVVYSGAVYPRGEMMGASLPWQHNSSLLVQFVDPQHWDLRLAGSNTSAAVNGTNLSPLFNYDILNAPRLAMGTWTRG